MPTIQNATQTITNFPNKFVSPFGNDGVLPLYSSVPLSSPASGCLECVVCGDSILRGEIIANAAFNNGRSIGGGGRGSGNGSGGGGGGSGGGGGGSGGGGGGSGGGSGWDNGSSGTGVGDVVITTFNTPPIPPIACSGCGTIKQILNLESSATQINASFSATWSGGSYSDGIVIPFDLGDCSAQGGSFPDPIITLDLTRIGGVGACNLEIGVAFLDGGCDVYLTANTTSLPISLPATFSISGDATCGLDTYPATGSITIF